MNPGRNLIIINLLILTGFISSCKQKNSEEQPVREILVQIGDSVLYQSDVENQIPTGLNTEDSINLFNTITERWIRNMIMTNIAAENLKDFDRINALTEQYRNDLIIDSYLRNKEEEIEEVSQTSINNYFLANQEKMLAKSPLIKGIYLKIPENDEKLSNIRKWMKDGSSSSIDNLEKNGLKNAAQYDLFKNQWIEWNEVADKIPYRFYDADAFLQSTKFFETSFEGWTYMLYIHDFTLTGDKLPKDYALKKVKESLRTQMLKDMRQNLLIELYKKGIKEQTITPGLYDLINHTTKKSESKK